MAKGLRRAGMSHIPVVLIISDFEGVGAHSWIESHGDNVVCGTSLCRQQALNMGIPPDQARARHPPEVLGATHSRRRLGRCGVADARAAAAARAPRQVFQTSGMILRPAFYEAVNISPDRSAAQHKHQCRTSTLGGARAFATSRRTPSP